MIINPIASSSKGNCYIISDGVTNLMLECGIQYKKIRSKILFQRIDGCLITHEHKDHSLSVKDILSACINVYSSKGTIDALNVIDYHLRPIEAFKTFDIGSFKVVAFPTQHDAAEPFGYLLYSTATQETVLFATDTYYVKYQFSNLNYIMVECNYAKDILNGRKDMTKTQRDRLLKSHFELSNVKEFLKHQDLTSVKTIYLMHLSSANSDEERFKKEIQEVTGKMVVVCPELE